MNQRSRLPGELAHRAVVGRRRHVVDVARDADAARHGLDLGPRLGDRGRAAERLLVHVAEVREVEQVVADQLLRRRRSACSRAGSPSRVVAGEVVGQQRRVGLRRVAHPDEHPLVLHRQRIALHARLRRHRVGARDLDAAAGRVEQQAVVAAAHAVAFLPALRQRRQAMAAAVAQGDDLAGRGAIEQDRLAEHGAAEQAVVRAPRDPRRSRTSSCERTWRRRPESTGDASRIDLRRNRRRPRDSPDDSAGRRVDDAPVRHQGDPHASSSPRSARSRHVLARLRARPRRRSPALADIHIGVTLSTTGPGASLGIPAEQALKMWPGEMAGEKVRFTILNDTTDTTTATKNAQRLINEDKVDLIIGSSVTPTSLAVVETAGAAQVPVISLAGGGAIVLPQDGPRKWAFKLSPTEPISIAPGARPHAEERQGQVDRDDRHRHELRRRLPQGARGGGAGSAASRSSPARSTTRPTRASPRRC